MNKCRWGRYRGFTYLLDLEKLYFFLNLFDFGVLPKSAYKHKENVFFVEHYKWWFCFAQKNPQCYGMARMIMNSYHTTSLDQSPMTQKKTKTHLKFISTIFFFLIWYFHLHFYNLNVLYIDFRNYREVFIYKNNVTCWETQ